MTFRPRPGHPYANAPRLPEGDDIDVRRLFPGEGPIEIEIGPGRGGFLFERALARPEALLLGIEIRMKWASLVDEKLRARGLGERARVVNGDARESLGRLGPDGAVDKFFLHFPDPWWKKRHEKRLVMGTSLLGSIARLLRDGGELYVQTDVEERADLYAEQIGEDPSFVPAGDEPGSARLAANPHGAESPREKHAIADGIPIYRLRYVRRLRSLSAG